MPFLYLKIMPLSFFLVFSQLAEARYPSALPNNNIKEEANNQDHRMIGEFEKFSLLTDGQIYFRNTGEEEFYHYLGYWVQMRMEVRPHDYLTLNLRSIYYSGSVSSGYTAPTGSYHLLGVSGEWPIQSDAYSFTGRVMDLERQTLGTGLLIEEKETAGVWLRWEWKNGYVKYLKEGTGGLIFTDDLTLCMM